ncbi:MAG: hypothetical protein K5838_01525 [Elusimicrobiales bacterium]|nr:hypothetical protein [Elusimicrobiales bacterium]
MYIYLLCLLVFATVMSQNPNWFGPMRIINQAVWILCLGILFVQFNNRKFPYKFLVIFILTYFWFYLFRYICAAIGVRTSEWVNLFTLVPVLLAYIAGLYISSGINDRQLNTGMKFYVFMVTLLSILVYQQFVGSVSAYLGSVSYVYGPKNSLTQFIFTAILVYLSMKRRNWWLHISAIVLFVIGMMLQCRAAVVAFAVTIFTCYWRKKQIRRIIFAMLFIGGITFLFSHTAQDIAVKAFALDRVTDMDRFSSGRLTLFSQAYDNFLNHPLVGTFFMVDNFFIFYITMFGIFGGTPIICLWLLRAWRNYVFYRNIEEKDDEFRIFEALFSVSVFFMIISLFEGGGPFVPGAPKFVLWILCGYADVRYFQRMSSLRKKDGEKAQFSIKTAGGTK